MKRGAASDDESDDERAPKRTRAGPILSEEFAERKRQPAFRDAHHPEKVLAQLLTQREQVLMSTPSFASDMRTGALTGPRLRGRGLLRVSTTADHRG